HRVAILGYDAGRNVDTQVERTLAVVGDDLVEPQAQVRAVVDLTLEAGRAVRHRVVEDQARRAEGDGRLRQRLEVRQQRPGRPARRVVLHPGDALVVDLRSRGIVSVGYQGCRVDLVGPVHLLVVARPDQYGLRRAHGGRRRADELVVPVDVQPQFVEE